MFTAKSISAVEFYKMGKDAIDAMNLDQISRQKAKRIACVNIEHSFRFLIPSDHILCTSSLDKSL
jgi:hypothetical protein